MQTRDLGPPKYLTQDRMLNLVEAAEHCLQLQKDLVEIIKLYITEDIAQIRQDFIGKGMSPDHPMYSEASRLIELFENILARAQENISPEDIALISEEKAYFRARYKQNRYARNNARTRRALTNPNAGSRLQKNENDFYEIDTERTGPPIVYDDEAALARVMAEEFAESEANQRATRPILPIRNSESKQ